MHLYYKDFKKSSEFLLLNSFTQITFYVYNSLQVYLNENFNLSYTYNEWGIDIFHEYLVNVKVKIVQFTNCCLS